MQPLIAGFLAEDFEKFPIEQDPAPSVQPLLIAGFLVENLQKLLAFQDAAKILADYAKLSSKEQNEKFSDTLRKIHQSTIDCDQYLDFVKKTHPNRSDIDDQQKGDRLQNVILRSVITELLSAGNPFCLLQLDDTDFKRVQWNEVSFTEKQTGETDVEFFIRRISKFLDPKIRHLFLDSEYLNRNQGSEQKVFHPIIVTLLCIRHGITLACELECHSWSPLTRQHNNLESHKSLAKKIMKMSGMQLIPTFYPVIAAQAILFKIVLSYPTADFHFMNFLMNLDLYGNGCIKVFRDSIFRLRGISDKFVFLDGFNAEEMVSSFVFAETFPFPLCPNDEEGMTIAKKVMLERWSGGKTILEQHRCNEDNVLGSYNDRVVTCMFGKKTYKYATTIGQAKPHFSGMHPEMWTTSSKRHCKTIGDNNNIIDVLLKMCFMFSFAKANPVFPVHILCNPIMCLKNMVSMSKRC